jgi:OmpA-OmpF porin, OOP family
MRVKLITLLAAGVLSCGLGAATAIAADSGFYGYVGAGASWSDRKAEVDTALSNAGATFTSTSDNQGVAYKVQAGYRINPYLAVEGGYMNMGKYTYDAVASIPAGATRQGTNKVDGWNLDVVGSIPVTDTVSVFAKAGVLYYDLSFSCSGAVITCVDPNRSKKSTAFHYGAGLEWSVWDKWFVRAEYEAASNVGDAFNTTGTTGTTRADVTMVSGGIGYKF